MDLVIEEGLGVTLVESKSGATGAADMLSPLNRPADLVAGRFEEVERVLVYGGDVGHRRSEVDVRPWSSLHDRAW